MDPRQVGAMWTPASWQEGWTEGWMDHTITAPPSPTQAQLGVLWGGHGCVFLRKPRALLAVIGGAEGPSLFRTSPLNRGAQSRRRSTKVEASCTC